jgi:hypothetical protein
MKRRWSEISSPESAVPFGTREEAQAVADEVNGTVVPMDGSHSYIVNGVDTHIEHKYFVVKCCWMYFNGFEKEKEHGEHV